MNTEMIEFLKIVKEFEDIYRGEAFKSLRKFRSENHKVFMKFALAADHMFAERARIYRENGL